MKIYTLNLTAERLQTILKAVGEMPTREGMPVVLDIQRQVAHQDAREAQPKAQAAPPPDKKPAGNGHVKAPPAP